MVSDVKEFILVHRKYAIVFVTLIFFITAICIKFFQITRSIEMGIDSHQLIILGESLRSGQGYSLLNLPDNPPANLYPPLYPLIIAASLILTENTYLPDIALILKIVNLVFFLLALLIFYHYLQKKNDDKKINLIALALIAVNPVFSFYINDVGTENLYLLLSITSVCLIEKMVEKNNKKYLYLGIIFAIFGFYARTIGIALIAAIILFLFFQKKYKEAIQSSLLSVLSVLPWFAYSYFFGSQPSYFKYFLIKNPYNIYEGNASFADFSLRIAENAIYYAQKIPELIFSVNLGSPIISLPLLFITLIGFLKMTGKKINLLRFYIPLYILILITWPFTEKGRFLIPILLFLIYSFVMGCKRIFNKNMAASIIQPSKIILLATTLAIIGSSFLIQIKHINQITNKKNMIIVNKRMAEISSYAKKEIPKENMIIFRKPYFLYLYNRQYTTGYPYTNSVESFKKAVGKYSPLYIIDDNKFDETKQYLQPVIEELKKENRIELVYKSELSDFKIYKLIWD
ncbi:MAG: hypothetical protein US76_01095 [Parcubacteria group bacterium GW2011_GWA2_38_13b]|nr:MAG: hypothetical protein US76_01095 [Parcubacteria group bacterium GW2011_GWA2_38_13b]